MLALTPTVTPDQVLSLAPDPAAAKAGRELAQPRKWALLARSEQALWGECQGSAADPYQTRIDLGGPAFKCSCPSHKLPCKHAMGLLLLYAAQPQAFPAQPAPQWVSEWMAARIDRAARTERAQKQAQPRAAAAPDPGAQAKRSLKRQARILAGLDELDLWLQDLARRGLASLQTQPAGAWEALAARMVDAQAPGLARQLREIAALPVAGATAGADWTERLIEKLGRLYLIIEGYRRLERLPPAVQADLRALVGWTVSQEELEALPGAHGQWLVLSQRVTREDRLRVQRTWLWSADENTYAPAALLLDFAVGAQTFANSLLPGARVPAEMVFYPGAYPLRAALRTRQAALPAEPWRGYADLRAAGGAFAAALARNPWLEHFPAPLQAVLPQRVGERWWLRDAAGQGWPLATTFEEGWALLALSGGEPLPVFGEWDGRSLRPLSAWAEGRLVPLGQDES